MMVVDLYHFLSRAMYYDLDKKLLIKDEKAVDLRNKIRDSGVWTGELKSSEAMKVDLGFKTPSIIYGNIYEL